MRWLELVVLCAVLSTISTEPEPKKYKHEVKPKVKEANSSLSDEERKFLREVEAKFGIKTEVPVESQEDKEDEPSSSEAEGKDSKPVSALKLPFPAVIAIEIVNDTETKSKGKRTIDANLGYGYRTNNGYTYSYFGKPAQEQGKFMIYPYSQEDIPPASSSSHGYPQQSGKTTKLSPNVEITPSQAFELVQTKEEEPTSYHYEKPSVQLKTKYESIHSVESPPPPYPASDSAHLSSPPSTLYTTYNGENFSGLSGHFPKVMSNYLVDPSQFINNPSFQSAGLTQDHLRHHGANLEQKVVPVLVLRIPSSYIKNPSAELYANLPQNYPLSQYLNNVNLQELVNQYFKKIGYPYAPKVMTYPGASLSHSSQSASPSVSKYEPQHYASPYVQPSYTHAEYSGVQYSAVQPVMAKYPSGYTRQQYYFTRPQSLYQQPLQQQQYVYRYKYVPQSAPQPQSYYSQPQYQQEIDTNHATGQQSVSHETSNQVEYSHQPVNSEEEQVSVQYEHPHSQSSQEYVVSHAQNAQEYAPSHSQNTQDYVQSEPQNAQEYVQSHRQISAQEYMQHLQSKQEYTQGEQVTSGYDSVSTATPGYEQEVSTPDYGPTKVPLTVHGSSPSVQVQYEQSVQKDAISVYPRSQSGHKAGIAQTYIYQSDHSGDNGLVLTENYPSKDHTIATVLPLSYTKQQHTEPIQSVSYVTPIPTMKYHSHYRVMVPQTILRRPTNEKVSYVHSHSLSSSHLASASQYNPEEEYTVSSHYVPPISKQKQPSYPRNYHAHPKRMAKPETKSEATTSSRKNERGEKKKSSSMSS